MSNKSRKLLFLILFLWILAIVAIYLAMGEPSDVEPLKGLSSQAKPLEQVLPKVPPLEPPQRPADELEGYGLCPTQGSSNGTFENISGHYDSFNRYVVILKLQGQVIAPSIHESLANARLNVTFADFPGQLNFVQEFFYEKGQGPVSVARLGLHRGFTRLSLNYHTQLSPKEVSVEVKCRDNAVALRYTFDISQKFSAANVPLRPEALPDPLAPTPNTQAQVDQLNQGPSLGQGAHETNEISLKPNEQSQEIITPSEPAKSTAEPKEVSDELAKEEPTTPSEHTDVHISIHKDDQLADKTGEISHPKDESLHAYEVCAPPTVGRGALGPLKGQYDSAGRYTVYFDLNGVLSRPKIITDLTGPAPVTYMDFPGNYTFQSELYRESKGPVRQIRYGQHQGFFRLSLTYREGREPKAAEPIIYCSQGKIAIVYTFIGGPTTEEALKAFNQINAIIPKPDYPYGLAPCSFVKQGNGSFGQLSGGYDEKGRYVIAADFSGSLGEYKQVTDHTGDPSVTFLDFSGLYKFSSDPIQETKGPVRLARFGAHDQVTRLSLTYRLGLAPTPPAAEIFCSATRLAIRYTFGELTDITKEYDETLAETIIPDELTTETIRPDDLAAKAGQPDELTTEISQPDESTTETIRPDEPTEKDDLAQYRPCPVDREAKGTLGQMTSHYDSEGRFVLLVDYTGQIGKYKYQSQLSEPIPFSYLDLMGELNFKQELLTNPTGPVRQVRIGQHNDFARLSFTYREKIAPKETKIEVLCHNNSLAVRYTFEDNGAAKKAAIDAFKPTVKSETAILAADDSQQTLVESDTKDSAQELTFPETNDTNETQATEEKEETEVT
ncbi:MAG: hypothetical protein LBE31_00470, partial [Deltaproteobacteria bacterium]|nr:hypothetical protein [Deltaproteobacteria bacterium]